LKNPKFLASTGATLEAQEAAGAVAAASATLVVLHRMRLDNELQCSDRQADALNLIAEKVSREVAATLACLLFSEIACVLL
jgi:hypothetical protein